MQVLYHDEPSKILIQTTKYAVKEFMCQNKKKQVAKEKQVLYFIIQTDIICEKRQIKKNFVRWLSLK